MAETKNILVEIDKDLWFKFRGRAFDQGKTVKDLLAEVMRNHLDMPNDETAAENKPSEPKKESSKSGAAGNKPRKEDLDTVEEETKNRGGTTYKDLSEDEQLGIDMKNRFRGDKRT